MMFIRRSDENSKPLKYPKLVEGHDGGLGQRVIVLMYAPREGTVLWSDGGSAIGHYSERWDLMRPQDYDGTLTLTNGGT